MDVSTIRWILFDLGNVLIDYRPGGLSRTAQSVGVPEHKLRTFFFEDGTVDRIDTGHVSPEAFVGMLNEAFGISVTRAAVVEWFRHEVENVYDGVPEMLASLADTYSLAILSNTFFGHWDYIVQTDFIRHFDVLMASHLLGYLKPDPRAYREALARMDAKPHEVLFIDDKEENVAAAQALGIHTIHAAEPGDWAVELRRLGLLGA